MCGHQGKLVNEWIRKGWGFPVAASTGTHISAWILDRQNSRKQPCLQTIWLPEPQRAHSAATVASRQGRAVDRDSVDSSSDMRERRPVRVANRPPARWGVGL